MEAQTGICPICSVQCTKICSKCKIVNYCSSEHQKSHWKYHKKDCFPVILQSDEIQGRYFITTKDLQPGELIFTDEALIYGPSGAEPYLHRICLGCYKVVLNGNKCSKCGWPICNKLCENVTAHSQFECPIITKYGIQYEKVITNPQDYDLIKYLRTILLQDKEPESWKQLNILVSHKEQRATNKNDIHNTMSAVDFIQNVCNLKGYDYDEINHVVGIWVVNSHGANPPSGTQPLGRIVSFLFPKASLPSHNCVANTRGILIETEDQHQQLKFTMKLVCSLPIPAGESIYTTYVNVNEGIYERQRILNENYYFTCKCKRCNDPTEFGTYFSAIRCMHCLATINNNNNSKSKSKSKSSSSSKIVGYLLPIDPANKFSIWKCSNCNFNTNDYGLISPPIYQVKNMLNEIMNEYSETTLDCVIKLEILLKQNSGVTLHPNHWILIEIEYNLVQKLVVYLLSGGIYQEKKKALKNSHVGNNGGFEGHNGDIDFATFLDGINEIELTSRLIELCQHCLSIANLILPGYNSYRGRLLYCLVEGQLNQILQETGSKHDEIQKQLLQNILKNAEEAYNILALEPDTTESGSIGKRLEGRIKQLKLMTGVFGKQNNNRVKRKAVKR